MEACVFVACNLLPGDLKGLATEREVGRSQRALMSVFLASNLCTLLY